MGQNLSITSMIPFALMISQGCLVNIPSVSFCPLNDSLHVHKLFCYHDAFCSISDCNPNN